MPDTLNFLLITLLVTILVMANSKTLDETVAMTVTVCTDAPPAAIEAISDWMKD